MLNRITPLAIAAAAIFSVATFTATNASARGHAGGRAATGGHGGHSSHVRQARSGRPARGTRTRATRGTRQLRTARTRPARINRSSSNNRHGLLNRAGLRNNGARTNNQPRALSANQSGLPHAVLAMRLAHIRQALQNGTINRAQAAMQIHQLMHGNQANNGNGTPGGGTTHPPQHGVCFHAPCNIPGSHTPPHRECFRAPCNTGNNANHPTHTPGNNGANNRPHRPHGPVAGGNGTNRPFRGFRFGASNGGGARTGGAPTVAAGGVPAPQPVANNANNCLTTTILPDGATLFRDLCTGQIAIAPAQSQDESQEDDPSQNQDQQ
jgi:hypothetical protein